MLPLRPNVCLLVFNDHGHLFLGERKGEPGIWQFPQGGVDEGYTAEESVIKELHEELGASPEKFGIVKRLNAVNEYDFQRVPPYAVGKWRGQRQSFWLVHFSGRDQDIDLNRFDPEFTAWQWCSPAEVRAVAEPKRLPGYEQAIREFEAFWQDRGAR